MNKTDNVIKIVDMLKNISTNAISTILKQGYGIHVVFATEGVTGLPQEWAAKTMVPLNFNPESYANYNETNDYFMFDTRFSGIPHSLTMHKKSIVEIRAIKEIFKTPIYTVVPINCIGVHDENLMKEVEKYLSDFSTSKNDTTPPTDPIIDDRPPHAIPGVPHLRRIK